MVLCISNDRFQHDLKKKKTVQIKIKTKNKLFMKFYMFHN
jgi:hypothetical protein